MKNLFEDIFDVVKTVVVVLVLAFVIRTFLFQPFVVDGHSMDPNFYDQEYLLVNKLTYRIGNPERGDVIVFDAPNTEDVQYIKRIIGLPGENVKIMNKKIYIDGKVLDEEYIDYASSLTLIKNSDNATLDVTLSDDEYFVLGDNREHSSDSREWGTLPEENIIGKAWVSIYPWDIFGFIPSPTYNL